MKTFMKFITNFILTALYLIVTPLSYAATPVAYIYVPTTKGIYAYDASSAGALTLIKGSPFKQTSGLLIGTNGTHLITEGTDYIHSYAVSSTGVIGAQVSEINTQSYSGSACGPTNGAVLDHSGRYIYAMLFGTVVNGDSLCNAYQTIEISSTGVLTFKGSEVFDLFGNGPGEPALPVVAGNDKFALALQGEYHGCGYVNDDSFTRESTGLLELGASTEKNPLIQPGSGFTEYQQAGVMTEDPTDHYAVVLVQTADPCDSWDGSGANVQIASYTGSASGLSSTNTWENMPIVFNTQGFESDGTPDPASMLMKMSPAGNILVATTLSDDGQGANYQLVFYHFNGAAPVTYFTTLNLPTGNDSLGGNQITGMQWDGSNHLYVLCVNQDANDELFVYTVTTKSAKLTESYAIPASGFTSPSPLVVRIN